MKIKKHKNKKVGRQEKKRIKKQKKEEKKKEKQRIKSLKLKKKRNQEKKGLSKRAKILWTIFSALVVSTITYFLQKDWIVSLASFLIVCIISVIFFIARKKLDEVARIRKMEAVFPDFLQLVSSNLRAGMTIDKSLVLSARKEFAPLDEEILAVGKDIMTGKEITEALSRMSKRIKSEMIEKTIYLIISGIRSGGNLSVLLEETSSNMRERIFVQKRAASNVLMYVIFVFFAIAVGAPVLFALSSVLVEVLTNLLSDLPAVETSVSLPFTMTSVNISTSFIIYFSLIFIIVIDVLASLILGLVSKGQEKQGLKYILPLIGISITLFFAVRYALLGFFADLI